MGLLRCALYYGASRKVAKKLGFLKGTALTMASSLGSNHIIPRYTPTNFHVAKRWRSRVARRSSTDFGAFCDRVWNILVANPVLVYLSARYAPFNGFIATRAPTSGKQLVRCCNLYRKREFGSCSAMVKKSELPPASACSLCLHLKGFQATCFHTCSLVFSSLLHQTNVNINNQIHLHITSALSAQYII